MDRAKLVKKYPTLTVRNRTPASQTLLYLNDSVTIAGGAERRVASDGLLQIPDVNLFELVKPTIFDLHKEGIIVIRDGVSGEEVKGKPDVSVADSAVEAGLVQNPTAEGTVDDAVRTPTVPVTTADVPVSPASPAAADVAPVSLTGKDVKPKRGS